MDKFQFITWLTLAGVGLTLVLIAAWILVSAIPDVSTEDGRICVFSKTEVWCIYPNEDTDGE